MLSVLRVPGAARAFLPSLVGRFALAMGVLALVLAVRRATGSFASAGLASAGFGFANVAVAPLRARALDRWGHRRALTPLGILATGAYAGLAVASWRGASTAVLVALAVVGGAVAPPLGAAMRTTWSSLTTAGDQRTAALSLDATADEVVFIAGPVAAAALAGAVSPGAAMLAAGAATLAGTLGLVTSPVAARPRGGPREPTRLVGPLRQPGFARVLVVLAGVGTVVGAVEVAAPAFAVDRHDVPAAGWLLAALSVGSALGGVAYGHVSWRSGLGRRMLICGAAMGALTCLTGAAGSLPLYGLGMVAVGAFLAPSIVTGYLAAEHLVPSGSATEASVWTNTALNGGAATANAVAGAVVAGSGVGTAMLVAGLVTVGAASCAPVRRLAHPAVDAAGS